MDLELIALLIQLISLGRDRNRNSSKTVIQVSTPVACLSFFFSGFIFGTVIFAFYRAFHLLDTLLFLSLLALLIGVAVRKGIISLGFKLSGWLAVIYAGFFIVGFQSVYILFFPLTCKVK